MLVIDLHFSERDRSGEFHLIVYVLSAAVLTLIGVTAVSSLDFTNTRRR
jgi:hypothetical protein